MPSALRVQLRGPIPACAGQPLPLHGRHPTGRAYPRVCGATCTTPRTFLGVAGLSPRVRGNLAAILEVGSLHGPIPACAGQPRRRSLWQTSTWAYPRVCGATSRPHNFRKKVAGLSPRVRGNLGSMVLVRTTFGPIPACAGQPKQCTQDTGLTGAYPRVCGATFSMVCLGAFVVGLSPRVRGNRVGRLFCGARFGPIPACAGQPSFRSLRRSCAWAYPRVCGATEHLSGRLCRLLGLSPRVRGNPSALLHLRDRTGPIPACAGQPIRQLESTLLSGAYPRVCGATAAKVARSYAKGGLSPRVRGNRRAGRWLLLLSGPIPACAGQPASGRSFRFAVKAYPRVCGATSITTNRH